VHLVALGVAADADRGGLRARSTEVSGVQRCAK
jgi:hypothetical protein